MSVITKKLRQTAVEAGHRLPEAGDTVDFKIVTFSLAGKDYGIDIMKIREIARIVNFTYVPNVPGFVRGVYNLRGEIISIIDLRAMFNLPFQQKASNEEESGLIVRLNGLLIGVIVDKIDKVIGINSKTIQPPHPIFGDINIKFISGVVENDGRLYIILDADRVLGKSDVVVDETIDQPFQLPAVVAEAVPEQLAKSSVSNEAQDKAFLRESLLALAGFTVSEINDTWFNARFNDWRNERPVGAIQLKTPQDAAQFLTTFASSQTGQLWTPEYTQAFVQILPEKLSSHINVWNPGCGRGFETYSLAILLLQKYPQARIKIWASDKDLMAISSAPNVVFDRHDIPELYVPYMTEGKNGLSFSPKVKEMILFEYHDMIHDHTLPPLDIVCSRDVWSFLPLAQQQTMTNDLSDMVKPAGRVILGTNECLPSTEKWSIQIRDNLTFAIHN
jgi:purine-binding chemotaxis protein CheW